MIKKPLSEVPKIVRLDSASLLSKWGFDDGDVLDWLLEFLDCSPHDVLIALVKSELLPALAQNVEIEIIDTAIHNPIRARLVDGQDVTKWHYEHPLKCPIKFVPEWVEVSGLAVLNIARRLG